MMKESLENTVGQDLGGSKEGKSSTVQHDEVNNLSEKPMDSEENPSDDADEKHDELDAETQDFLTRLGLKGKSKREVIELKKKLEEMSDKHLRCLAEFENAKRRNAKERLELMKTASQDVMQSLLPVLDDFERALKQMEQATSVEAVREGVVLIHDKLKGVLEQKGLKRMDSLGQEFNVEQHEAVTEILAPSESMKGKVIDEIERGYVLNDKIIRYAKVIVGK